MTAHDRLRRLQQALKETSCDTLLIEDSVSLFYLTGLDLSAGKLLVTPTQTRLLVDGRYFEAARKTTTIAVTLHSQEAFNAILKEWGTQQLAFTSEETSYQRFQELSTHLHTLHITASPLPNPVKQLRITKDPEEISLLRQAGILGSRGFDLVCDLLQENITEADLAQELQLFWLRHGAKKVAFDPIIAFGPNSSQPHYRAGTRRLQRGDTVLIDIGVTLNHYHSDMTRVVFFGEPPNKMRDIYTIVLEAQQAALAMCRPGVTVGELDQAARQHITRAGYGEQFSHSLGHGIGLEVHEAPTVRNSGLHRDMVLHSGMAMTIEPGIYLPDLGGVRIEDTVVMTAEGYEDLTYRSKELRIIPTD